MDYYAHTAERGDGSRDPDTQDWQSLRDHLRNVARLAKKVSPSAKLAMAMACPLASPLKTPAQEVTYA
jgi:hypothetical protein